MAILYYIWIEKAPEISRGLGRTMVNADKILVIKNGVVTEQGTHDELMERKGYYYRLYTNQFNEKLEAEILGVREEKQEEELPDYESED